MTDTSATLRRRIEGAADLQSVVRSMKAMAASNIGQYQRSVRALAEYHRTVELGLAACFRDRALAATALRPSAPVRDGAVGAVVFGSDQGLVGRFNEVVADHAIVALGSLGARARVWAVGERVHARLAESGLTLAGLFPEPVSVQAIAPLVGQILLESDALGGSDEGSELHLFYNRPATGTTYSPAHHRLLPLDEAWHRRRTSVKWPSRTLPETLGEGAATVRALIREYLFVSLFRACAESLASENASRLAAMTRADENIDEVLTTLRSGFQHLRQSGIDEELFDVISGFEALENPGR